MKRILALPLLCLCMIGVAHATIYSWKDANGNTVFSDQKPPPGVTAQKLKLKPIPTVPATSLPPAPPPTDRQQTHPTPVTHPEIEIVSPKNEQAIRANNGDISIDIQVKPGLAGYQAVHLYVDEKMVSAGHSLNVQLRNMDRGEHHAYAVLTDAASGQVLRRSKTVTFYVLRHSVLFKKPKTIP